MKPNWGNAPRWADWLAQDASGQWWWYEREPRALNARWVAVNLKSKQLAGKGDRNSRWRETLEERPLPSTVDQRWRDAPEWARWLTQSADGTWWWHKNKPMRCELEWGSFGRCEPAEDAIVDYDWSDSLEARP